MSADQTKTGDTLETPSSGEYRKWKPSTHTSKMKGKHWLEYSKKRQLSCVMKAEEFFALPKGEQVERFFLHTGCDIVSQRAFYDDPAGAIQRFGEQLNIKHFYPRFLTTI